MQRLSELLPHVRRCHSAAQVQHFIVTKGGAFCDYGAFRQATREVARRTDTLRGKLFRMYELDIDIEELEEAVAGESPNSAAKTTFDERRDALKLASKRCELETLKSIALERAGELAHFYACACALKDRIELHGELTPERHEELDMEMWVHRLRLDVAHDMRAGKPVSRSVWECIVSLPASAQAEVGLDAPGELLAWAKRMVYTLPKLDLVMAGKEMLNYVADNNISRLGVHDSDDAPAGRVLESVAD